MSRKKMFIGNRWYDQHPRVSFAVSCIENADPKLKDTFIKLIIKDALAFRIKATRPKAGLFRRWYDKDKNLSLAMEYFKNANKKQRVAIAEHLIAYIRENNITLNTSVR